MSGILDGTVPYAIRVLGPQGFGLIQGIRTYKTLVRTSQKTQCLSITKSNQLMMYGKRIVTMNIVRRTYIRRVGKMDGLQMS